GDDLVDKVVHVDQSPIGRTPRSNPATYTGVFDHVRKLFAETTEAKVRGYMPGRFSFNVKGGRCENCAGDGTIKIEMNFLPDVYVPCEVCHGARYNRETLEVHYKGKSIADVLNMPIEEAMHFFEAVPAISRHLKTLNDVGLGYVRLGQAATTLSGGEAQRVKLASELQKRSTGRTVYVLDEPTTGLHFEDISKLLKVLSGLVDKGNTVIVIEHNLDVIKTADWIVDMGPEGGAGGGLVVAEGTPEQVAAVPASHTGKFLREILGADRISDAQVSAPRGAAAKKTVAARTSARKTATKKVDSTAKASRTAKTAKAWNTATDAAQKSTRATGGGPARPRTDRAPRIQDPRGALARPAACGEASDVAHLVRVRRFRARTRAGDRRRAGREAEQVPPAGLPESGQLLRAECVPHRQPVQQRRVHRVAGADGVHHRDPLPGHRVHAPVAGVRGQSLTAARDHHRRRTGRQPLPRISAQPLGVLRGQLHQRHRRQPPAEPRPVGVRVGDQPRPDVRVQRREHTLRRRLAHQLLVRGRARLEHQRAGPERHRPGAGRQRVGHPEQPVRGALHIEGVRGRPVRTDRGHGQGGRLVAALHRGDVHPGG